MASGWNLWLWLEGIGVVSGCCCKEVYIIIDFLIIFLIPTPLVSAHLLQQHSYYLFSFKMFFK